MRKYFAIARAALMDAVQEKAEILIWILLDALPVFIMGSLWLTNQQHLVAMSLSQIITYYLMIMIVGRVTEFYFDEDMSDWVRTGEFSRFLMMPVRVPLLFIPHTLGRKVFSATVFLIPLIAVLSIAFRQYLVLPSLGNAVLFSLSLFVTLGIRFTLSALAGAGAFFWERAEALTHARWVLEIVAGGYALPLSLYPEWLRVIPDALPFKYAYYVPVSIFTGMFDVRTALLSLLGGVSWLIALLFFTRWIWAIGIRRYSSVGG